MCIQIINSIPLTIYGHEQKVKVADIPVISSATKQIFTELGCATSDAIIYPMKEKAESLAAALRALGRERRDMAWGEHHIRTIAAISTIACMTLVAVSISSITSSAAWSAATVIAACSLPITILTSVVATVLIACHNMSRIENGQTAKAGLFTKVAAVLAGPLFAIYDSYSAISKLKRIIAHKTDKIEKKFSLLTHHIEQIDAPKLRSAIAATLGEIDQSLKNLNNLSIVPDSGRKQLEEMKKPYQAALNELERAVAYYKRPESREALEWKKRFEALEARCNSAIEKLDGAAASELSICPQLEVAD